MINLGILLYSKIKKEKIAQENLERQGYKTYLPLINYKTRRCSKPVVTIEPLFPRYLFIHLSQISDNWSPIRSTIGVSKIVSFDYIPAQVPDFFVSTLMKNENEEGVQCLPVCGYQSGEVVQIIDGPIEGYRGIFMAETSRERVIILLSMLNKQAKLTLPVNSIERVNTH